MITPDTIITYGVDGLLIIGALLALHGLWVTATHYTGRTAFQTRTHVAVASVTMCWLALVALLATALGWVANLVLELL